MHMICPSKPIPASTELTEFLHISFRKKNYITSFRHPLCWRSGAHASPCPLPTATGFGESALVKPCHALAMYVKRATTVARYVLQGHIAQSVAAHQLQCITVWALDVASCCNREVVCSDHPQGLHDAAVHDSRQWCWWTVVITIVRLTPYG